jgi:hypothetical protein
MPTQPGQEKTQCALFTKEKIGQRLDKWLGIRYCFSIDGVSPSRLYNGTFLENSFQSVGRREED